MIQNSPQEYLKEVIEGKVRQWLIEHRKKLMSELIKEKQVGEYKEARASDMFELMCILMNDEGYKEKEAWEIVSQRYLPVN